MKIFVQAHPKSKRVKLVQKDPTHFEIWVSEAPDKGKANQAILEALSDHLDIAKSRFSIISGATSKIKVIEFL